MRSNTDLLEWARTWHWPRLILSEKQKTCIQAGEEHWRTFVAQRDTKAKLQAWQRISAWESRAREEKVG